MQIILNGNELQANMTDSLTRAVIISLFTWKHADTTDQYDGSVKYGWWADELSTIPNDEIGSKLWQDLRLKLTNETLLIIQEHCEEALQWLIDDGIASAVTVTVERANNDRVNVQVIITADSSFTYEFKDINNGNN